MTRPTIGFLIHRLDNDYSTELIRGAVSAANEYDVNIVIIPGRSLNPQLRDDANTKYEYQQNVIYKFVSSRSLDAAVVSAATIGQFVDRRDFQKFLSEFSDMPIVTMEDKYDRYPCIKMTSSGIKQVVSHLINEHKLTKIGFISGPMSNADARERLEYYNQALRDNDIDYDERLVRFGDFSEYSDEIVADLLDSVPDIQAICFANDMMCRGGYREIQKRGLVIGKDIFVTGYDDSKAALSLQPPLTTVRADASRVGYYAMVYAINLINDGTCDDLELESRPVYRQSCGCNSIGESNISEFFKNGMPDEIAEHIIKRCIPDYDKKVITSDSHHLRDAVAMIVRILKTSDANYKSKIEKALDQVLTNNSPFEYGDIFDVINLLRKYSTGTDQNSFTDSVFTAVYKTFSDKLISLTYENVEDIQNTYYLISNITKDMVLENVSREQSFSSVMNNLSRIHLRSSYIYTYGYAIHTEKSENFVLPKYVNLRCFHVDDDITLLPPEDGQLRSYKVFNNAFVTDERHTFVAIPLYLKEEQFGIIMCETHIRYYPVLYALSPQVSLAIKFTDVLLGLEYSLDKIIEENELLEKTSMHDDLTGVYNRRGFAFFARKLINAEENAGKTAYFIYADVDNLKKINDTFGHSEGDFAISNSAGILLESLGGSDIVGRMGGDEFAAIFIGNDPADDDIAVRIKENAARFNSQSVKDYNLNISVGISKILCSPDATFNEAVDEADAALYEDKKNKCFEIMK